MVCLFLISVRRLFLFVLKWKWIYKSIIAVNDEIWVGTNGSGIRIISASTGKELSAIEHTSNADAICSNAVYSLLKEDDMLL